MPLKKVTAYLCIMLGVLCTSHLSWAQEVQELAAPSKFTLQLAERMEKAQSVKEVIEVLRKVSVRAGLTDRLLIYDSIPKHIVDADHVMQIVHQHIRLQPDIAYATELVYTIELASKLAPLTDRKNHIFIRNLFFDSMIEWRDIVEAEILRSSEVDAKEENRD